MKIHFPSFLFILKIERSCGCHTLKHISSRLMIGIQNLNLDIVFYSFNLFFFFSKPRTRENICIIVFSNSIPGSKNPKIEAFALSLEDETLLKIITITDLPSPATKKNNGDIPRFQRIFTYSYFFILEKMKVSLIPLCG